MKLCQFHLPGKGLRVGVVEGDVVVDVTAPRDGVTSVRELIETARTAEALDRRARALLAGRGRGRFAWADLDRAPSPRRPHLLAPLDPPEVWGAGITYQRSREYYEAHGTGQRTKGIYDYVYEAKRPELFFKATASRAVGPNGPIGVRKDSVLTAVEPELAVILGPGSRIVGYTIGNDLSAWDIERENPLFLPQSKMFQGCFAFGPVLVTAREIGDPQALALTCRILRDDRVRFEGRVSTGQMRRRCDELVDWLVRSNPVPAGTVLSTGTGILVPDEHALREGDLVEIEVDKIGTLRNPVRRVG